MKELVKPVKTSEDEELIQALINEGTCSGYCTSNGSCGGDCYGTYNDVESEDDILL